MMYQIYFKSDNGHYYRHRLEREFWYEIDPRLRAVFLELNLWIWLTLGKTLTVTCLNRTREENEKVGGSTYSAHLDRRAGDLRSRKFTADEIQQIEQHLEQVWGKDFLFVLCHNSGTGPHIHVNIRFRHRLEMIESKEVT